MPSTAADVLVAADVTLGTPGNCRWGGGCVGGLSVAIDESAALAWSRPPPCAAASTAAAAAADLECTPYKYLILLFHTAVGLKYRLSLCYKKINK